VTRSADVVVVGYGPAGAAAALAAHDAGRSVLVLEKTGAGGGNAIHSGGFLYDVPDPAAAEHVDALAFGRTERPVIDAYVNGLHALDGWLRALGAETEAFAPPPARFPASFPSWPHFPAGDRIGYRVVSGGEGWRGLALWRALERAVGERKIMVEYDARVVALLRDEDGAVAGVVAGDETIHAGGGVILACGGFEGDPGLADAYLPLGPTWPVGHQANTGDGLRLGQSAGAALWHMYGFFGWFAFRTPEFPAPFAIDLFGPGFVMVDADGRRFADETGYEVHDRLRALSTYLPHNPNRPCLPSWTILDGATLAAGPLNGLLGTPNDYVWSADNWAEVERGWILHGRSPQELAATTGLGALAETLAEYRAATAAGEDPRFHRAPDTLVALDETDLYAIETWPGVAGTTGGPRRDAHARVIDEHGQPIPGLYAAGAISLIWGHLIDHGGGLTDALIFGRLAGEHAATRTGGLSPNTVGGQTPDRPVGGLSPLRVDRSVGGLSPWRVG
jgi:succinate dehydrogenase/fumarate reductase flavoprotein subunit